MIACLRRNEVIMKNQTKGNQKHLALSQRLEIEKALLTGESFVAIAKHLITIQVLFQKRLTIILELNKVKMLILHLSNAITVKAVRSDICVMIYVVLHVLYIRNQI